MIRLLLSIVLLLLMYSSAEAKGLLMMGSTPTTVTIQWIDNSNNETGFQVWRNVTGGTFVNIATVTSTTGTGTGSTITYRDSNVIRVGNTYQYYIIAVNATDSSTASATLTVPVK